MHIKKVLFKIARSRFAAYFVGFAFAHFTRLMPLERHLENRQIIVFKHPAPSWQTHWLGVPKRRLRSLAALDLNDAETQQIILAVYQGLLKTAVSLNLPSFAILVNGGSYQDVPQLHFHLISGPTASGKTWEPEQYALPAVATEITQNDCAIAYPHPVSSRDFHFIIVPQPSDKPFHKTDFTQPEEWEVVTAVLQLAQHLITQHNLPAYRLQLNRPQSQSAPMTFHLLT